MTDSKTGVLQCQTKQHNQCVIDLRLIVTPNKGGAYCYDDTIDSMENTGFN